MFVVEAESINDAYLQLTNYFKAMLEEPVTEQSDIRTGRNHGELYEARNVAVTIADPRKCVLSLPYRNASRKYMAGEFACYMQEFLSREFAYYGKMWADLDVDGTVQSNYGWKIFKETDGLGISRYAYAIKQLRDNQDSKNAVIMMRDWRDMRPGYQKDRCCTLALQFFMRDNKLHLNVHMRSSDFWMGMPYDIFWYSFVQQRALCTLRSTYPQLELGELLFQCASLHVYKKHWQKLLDAKLPEILKPYLDYQFPEWTNECEHNLEAWLKWEKAFRNAGEQNGKKFTELELDAVAMELRALKLPPFLETLGSYLLNNIKQRYATNRDYVMIHEAKQTAGCSSCIDRKVGCVLMNKNGVTVAGYNEVHKCNKQCDDKHNRICETTHAEISALEGMKLTGEPPVKAWVTLYPCRPCMKALMEANPDIEIVVAGFSHKGAGGTVTLLDPAMMEDKLMANLIGVAG